MHTFVVSCSSSSSTRCQLSPATGVQRQRSGGILPLQRTGRPGSQKYGQAAWHLCCVTRAGLHEQVDALQQTQQLGAVSMTPQPQQQQPEHDEQQQAQQQQQGLPDSPAVQPAGSSPAADAISDATTSATSSSSSSSTTSESEAPDAAKNKYTYFYTTYWKALESPVPVQMPPPDAASFPPVRPFFPTKKYFPPSFLKHYAAPPNSSYNYLSFLGDFDPNRGKYLAAGAQLDDFLTSCYKSVALANRRMYLAESYQGQPFKFYQELDFPWSMDPQLVLQLIPQVVNIVAQEVARVYADQLPAGVTPQPLLSMRTVYKVHLNFPGINTMEAKAGVVRKAAINRCRAELSGQAPLDKLKAELVVQEHWQEAGAVLVQLQQLAQQLQQSGQQLPLHAARLLEQHQSLLETAQRANSSSSSGSSKSSSSTQPAQTHLETLAAAPELQHQGNSAPQQQEALPGQEPQQQQQQVLSLQEQQQQQVDWESIIDFPHGSLRLLGSCKSPWMDSDPEWVTEKSYSRVVYKDGVWMRQPLTLSAVMECSILLEEGELRVFEQTKEFMDHVFQAAQQREQVLEAKRVKRAAKKQLESVQQRLAQPQGQQQQPGGPAGPHQLSSTERAALKWAEKQQRKEEQQQAAAQEVEAKAELERRKAEALARLQAANAGRQSQQQKLTRPGFSRPAQP